MWKSALILLLLFQIDHEAPADRVLGILEAPDLLGDGACSRYVPATLDVHAEPAMTSPAVGLVEVSTPWFPDAASDCQQIGIGFRSAAASRITPVRLMEHSYETLGLVVLDGLGENQQDAWYRIDLGADSGWIAASDAGAFLSYESLVLESLAYIAGSGPVLLWEAPGAGTPQALRAEWQRYVEARRPVEVLESRLVDGEVWFRIRLDGDYACESLDEGPPPIEGWIPGHDASGKNALWFNSRGC